MTIRQIGEDVTNSNIEYCINEYVRPIEYREILRKHWFEQRTAESLAEEYNRSLASVKKIIYGTGDRILIKASKMCTKTSL